MVRLIQHIVIIFQIVLDEAQMVEKTTVRAAEMVKEVMVIHRWCVTGTPIQRDLKGNAYHNWQGILIHPYLPTIHQYIFPPPFSYLFVPLL